MKKGRNRSIVLLYSFCILITLFLLIGMSNVFTNLNSNHSQELEPSQFRTTLMDGWYINHTWTLTGMGTGPSSFSYRQLSPTLFHVDFTTFLGSGYWDVNIQNRIMSNSGGTITFGNSNHDPSWIFTNVSLGDLVPIAVDGEVDHFFNVSAELTTFIPGHGNVDVWVLEDLTTPPGSAWYSKASGILIDGTYYYSGGASSYTWDFVDTNIEFQQNNYTPALTMGSVNPLTGDQTTLLNFSVVYSDLDNNSATFVNLLINGSSYSMIKQNPTDLDYTDGCLYQYLTALQPGTYNYFFDCSDGKYFNSTSTFFGLTVTPTSNTNPPLLNQGQVNPNIGFNASTIFSFRVNYTDLNNNPPNYVNVTINGPSFSMEKENPLDPDFIDGCWYVYPTVLPDIGIYTFYFNCSDGVYNASLGPLIGPTVNMGQLFDGMQVDHYVTSTLLGNGLSNFTYSYVGGSTYNVTWVNYFNSWYVDESNRIISNEAGGWFTNGNHDPSWVLNTISLGDTVPIAVIVEADHSFNVTDELIYFLPGFGPIEVWVLEDLTAPPGVVWYEKSTGILLNGTFYFLGTAWYHFDFLNTNAKFMYIGNDYVPELTSGAVDPLEGNQTTFFNFTVVYTDADNNAPNYVHVSINGTPYLMTQQNPSDTNYTDGCLYQYVTTLQPGIYNYSFEGADYSYTNSTMTYYLIVNMTNDFAPQLVNPQVNPIIGSNSILFNFTVTYYDADNNLPLYINLTINTTSYLMLQANILDANFMDGALYYYLTTLDWGFYQFQISCSDGAFLNSTTWIDAPEVNPFYNISSTIIHFQDDFETGLSQWQSTTGLWHLTDTSSAWPNPVHSPTHSMWFGQESTGDYATGSRAFGEIVTIPIDLSRVSQAYLTFYHWRAGEAGWDYSYVNITTNGLTWTVLYQTDQNIALWANLTLDLSGYTGNSSVELSFYFDTRDGGVNNYRGWLIDDIIIYTPSQGEALQLLSPINNSNIFTGLTNFTWTSQELPFGAVTYNVEIANMSDFSTIIYKKEGIIETPGTTGTALLLNFSSGAYYWRVRPVLWGFYGNWSNSFRFYLIYNELAPNLMNGAVAPSTGNQFSYFNFTVIYLDQDNNAPASINVTINGISYQMGKSNESDTNYMDGSVYNYSTQLSPGLYNYSFECSDGKFSNGTIIYTGLNVIEVNFNSPVLNNGQVNPSLGYNGTSLFIFTVRYSDADNNAPSYVNLTINLTMTFTMIQQNPLDTNYIDGTIFTYSTFLVDVGNYFYYFNCSDGFLASAGPYSNLRVELMKYWNETRLDGVRIGAVITHGEDNPRTIYPTIINELIRRGATITDITTTISSSVLTNYDIIWFDEYGAAMTASEITAIQLWVAAGGRFLITGDNMGSAIGLVNRFNISYGAATAGGTTNVIYPHPITFRVNQIYFPSPSASLILTSQPKAILCVEWNTYDLVTAMDYGAGRFVIIVDENVLTSLTSANNHQLLNNTFGWLGAFPNDYAPILTSGMVVPQIGNQATQFNFSVVYTDLDNKPPSAINVVINGTPYSMTKQSPSDFDYTDGTLYQYTSYLSPGNYYYSFNCSDGIFTNSTQISFGPNVILVNSNPPILNNGQVNPPSGYNGTTLFVYTVNYVDADNNLPIYVNVTIGSTTYLMIQQNPLDSNYLDGALFTFGTTLDVGLYTYYFNCSDGGFTTSLGPYIGPNVEEDLLENYMMIPDYTYQWEDATLGIRVSLAGQDDAAQLFYLPFNFRFYNESFNSIYVCTNGFVSFVYRTTFTNVPFPALGYNYMIAPFWDDLRSENPCNIFVRNLTAPNRVVIEWQNYYTLGGTLVGTFEVVLYESGDIIFNYDYLDYASSYTAGLNYGPNINYYNAVTSLNTSMDDFSILFTKISNDYAPELTNGSVNPTNGTQLTEFNFTVIYSDSDNNPPTSINTVINGLPYPMYKQNQLDVNYTDGCLYRLLVYLQPGNYNYSFNCYDGKFSNSTIMYFGLNVTEVNFNPPTLTNGQVNPPSGYNGTTPFVFSVNYVDLDNNAPRYVNVTINSTIYSMVQQNPLDTNYQDGSLFVLSTTLQNIGTYSYYFSCSDSNYTASLGPYSGPTVREAQLFNGMYIDYDFTSSIGGSGPSRFSYLHITGPSFTVTWSSSFMPGTWAVNLLSRLISNSTAGFSSGTHAPDWIFINVSLGDSVPISVLFAGDHFFNVSGELEYFIPGFGSVEIWVLADLTTPGYFAWYEKSSGLLINGTFPFFGSEFYTFDFGDTNVEFIYIPNIYSPELSSGAVVPISGYPNTLFNFSVIYSDLDDNQPVYINVLINGTPYAMSKINPMDFVYADGCGYQALIYLQPGLYNYSFECADWDYSSTTPTYFGINVSRINLNSPILSGGQVTPNLGYRRSTFVFSVNYQDPDNNEPLYLNVIINSTTYAMIKQDLLDINYMDGCLYILAIQINISGVFTYYFNSSDGIYIANLGPFSGPTVQTGQLFDGMYIRNIFNLGTVYPSLFTFTYNSGTSFHIVWDITAFISEWDENLLTRIMVNSTGGFGNNVHTPLWIFTNVTLNDTVLIAVDGEGDHVFRVMDDLIYDLPGFGPVEVWILEDITGSGGFAWYEKSTGILLNATFYYSGGSSSYTVNFVDSNAEFTYISTYLSLGGVRPLVGSDSNSYNFTVLYVNRDNIPPVSVELDLDSVKYTMSKINPLDVNYSDGVWYQYYNNSMSIGFHTFRFLSQVGNQTLFYPFGGEYLLGPNVTSFEFSALFNGLVSPLWGSQMQTYRYSVMYQDTLNNMPLWVSIYIDGVQYFMTKDPSDNDFTDGVEYYYENAMMLLGSHTFYFEADNTTTILRYPTVGLLTGPQVLLLNFQSNYTSTPPTIDGIFNASEWDAAIRYTTQIGLYNIMSPDTLVRTLNISIWILNDGTNLYICIMLENETFNAASQGDLLGLLFDANLNGVLDVNEHGFLIQTDPFGMYFSTHDAFFNVFYSLDYQNGGTEDGNASVSHTNMIENGLGIYTFELSMPYKSLDIMDLQLSEGASAGIKIFYIDYATALIGVVPMVSSVMEYTDPSTFAVLHPAYPPSSNHPADIIVLQNTSNVNIIWRLQTAFEIGMYRVLRNGSLYQVWQAWTGNNTDIVIAVNTTASVGFWRYCIEYNDSRGILGVPDIVLVTLENLPWIILSPSPTMVAQNATGLVLNWTFGDQIGAGVYSVYINSSPYINSIAWVNNTAITVIIDTNRGWGYFIYQVRYWDCNGFEGVSDDVIVTVNDRPTAVGGATINNTFIIKNETGYMINWTLYDNIGSSGTWKVLLNGSLYVNWTTWNSSMSFTVPIDTNRGIALFNYTLQFQDIYGVFGYDDSIFINIIDLDFIPPSGYTTYPLGNYSIQTGTLISISGFANGTGSPILSITINSSSYTLMISPLGQLTGIYQFINITAIPNGLAFLEVNITDMGHNSAVLIIIFIVDNARPNLIVTSPAANGTALKGPSIIIEGFADGTHSNIMIFTFNSTYFNLTIDPTNQPSGIYQLINNTAIQGYIAIEISIVDNASLTTSIIIWFYVDSLPPYGYITYPTSNFSIQSGTLISISGFAAGTGSPIQSVTINSTSYILTQNPIGQLSGAYLFVNNTPIQSGLIFLQISIIDLGNNSAILTISFIVDNIIPTITILSPINGTAIGINLVNITGIANGTLSNILSIQINDSRFIINPLIDPTNSTSGPFSFTNISRIQGPITLQITVIDEGGSTNSIIVQIYVDSEIPYATCTNIQLGGAICGNTLQIRGLADGTGSPLSNITINETRFTLQLPGPIGTLAGQYTFQNNSNIADGFYSIRIRVVDMVNRTFEITLNFYIDNTAPPKVSFTAVAVGNSVNLAWSSVSDLTNLSYLIFRNGQNVANTTGLLYSESDLSPGYYIYSICAMDNAGNFGEISSTSVTIEGKGGDSTLLLILLIIVIGSVAGVSLVAISRRRKKSPTRSTVVQETRPPKRPIELEILQEAEPLRKEIPREPQKVESLRETPQIELETTEFYCTNCKKYTQIVKADASINYACDQCIAILVRVMECPQCHKKITMKQETYRNSLGKSVNCPLCKETINILGKSIAPRAMVKETGSPQLIRNYMKLDPEQFTCPSCKESIKIENADNSQNYACVLCGNSLKRIFKCPQCDYTETIDQEKYPDYTKRQIECPKCKEQQKDEELSKIFNRLRSKDIETRVLAAELLGEIGNRKAGPFLTEMLLYDKENHARAMAALALGMIGLDSALPVLKRLAEEEKDPEVRDCASKAVKWIESKSNK